MLLRLRRKPGFNQIISYSKQKMNSHNKNNLLADFPHLQLDWRPLLIANTLCYQHSHSQDLSELRNLHAITLRELDIYASRENYCFPYCPRIYKYVIQQNDFNSRQPTFHLQVLVEKVSHRLSNNFLHSATEQELTMLANKTSDIVRGFEYLFKRFGAFHIRAEMIGWTDIDVIKVWFNEDFASNRITSPTRDVSIMVEELIDILEEYSILRNRHLSKEIRTFEQLYQELTCPPYQRRNNRFRRTQCSDTPIPAYPNKVKKNITFSYSNKDIGCKSMLNDSTANSFRKTTDSDVFERTGDFMHEIKEQCSLKMILPPIERNTQKKVSVFRPNRNPLFLQTLISDSQPEGTKTSAISDRYSTAMQAIYPQASIFEQWEKGKRELLHYSTSSNPYSKFVNMKPREDKNSSTAANESNAIYSIDGVESQANEPQKVIKQTDGNSEMWQQSKDMRSSQEIKADLDELFLTEKNISFSELQDELQQILL